MSKVKKEELWDALDDLEERIDKKLERGSEIMSKHERVLFKDDGVFSLKKIFPWAPPEEPTNRIVRLEKKVDALFERLGLEAEYQIKEAEEGYKLNKIRKNKK